MRFQLKERGGKRGTVSGIVAIVNEIGSGDGGTWRKWVWAELKKQRAYAPNGTDWRGCL